MNNNYYCEANKNNIIVIDRKYIVFELKKRKSVLLNKNGGISDDMFDLLFDEVTNHITGFLIGCIDNVTVKYT